MNLAYCFVGKEGEMKLKVLVARDGGRKAVFAGVASRKGGGGEGVVLPAEGRPGASPKRAA